MSRTHIPADLIHQPTEVDRNGKRFDYLCQVAEEVAFPIVHQALFREYNETTSAGAQILTDEAKQALVTIAEDAAILENLDEEKVIEDLRKTLNETLPPPDEEECRLHTRDFSQLLMSTWLETLRNAQANVQILELSDSLLPIEPLTVSRLIHRFVAKQTISETITDALTRFAPNEEEIITVLTTLRHKLFAEPRVVALPFDLAMIGAPPFPGESGRVRVMKHELFNTLLKEMESQQRREREREEQERERVREAVLANSIIDLGRDYWKISTPVGIPEFSSPTAKAAAANMCAPLAPSRYRYFAAIRNSQLQPSKIETTVKRARAATTD